MIEFISAVYNEEDEINDLLGHVYPYVDRIHIVDDVSTDTTPVMLHAWWETIEKLRPDMFSWHQMEEHTGLCELVRIKALEFVDDDSWVIMLDADERFFPGTLELIRDFIANPTEGVTHLFFSQREYIDNIERANFAKVKVFKKSAAHLPDIIHRDPQFDGEPANIGGSVIHRKTSKKQMMREMQYLDTYDRLLGENKVTPEDVAWFKSMHHFVRERHG